MIKDKGYNIQSRCLTLIKEHQDIFSTMEFLIHYLQTICLFTNA